MKYKIIIFSLSILLISSLTYVVNEDILKFLYSGTSATYAVEFIYNKYWLVLGLSLIVILFRVLSEKKKWSKSLLIISLIVWVLSLRTYAIIGGSANTTIVQGISILPLSKSVIFKQNSIRAGKFDFFLRRKLIGAIENQK